MLLASISISKLLKYSCLLKVEKLLRDVLQAKKLNDDKKDPKTQWIWLILGSLLYHK